MIPEVISTFFTTAAWPLCRLLFSLAFALFLASLLESLRWTDNLAQIAMPLSKVAHLSQTAAAAFALSFISPSAANAQLSHFFDTAQISMRELMLANLFNSLPAFFSHVPTIFLLIWPVLGPATFIYIGITFLAAIGRTVFTILIARILLPSPPQTACSTPSSRKDPLKIRLKVAITKSWKRFQKRLAKLILFTVPIYILMYIAQTTGLFASLELWLANHLSWLSFLKPQAMSIIAMQLMAEMGASLGAASAALQAGSLSYHDVIIAMLAGNVLATPIRAIRHQMPAYAAFYRPITAMALIAANQMLRAISLIVAIILYIFCA